MEELKKAARQQSVVAKPYTWLEEGIGMVTPVCGSIRKTR